MNRFYFSLFLGLQLFFASCGKNKAEAASASDIGMHLSSDTVYVSKTKLVSVTVSFEKMEQLQKLVINVKDELGVSRVYRKVLRADITNNSYIFEYPITQHDPREFNFVFVAYNMAGALADAGMVFVQTRPALYVSNLKMISKVTGKLLSAEPVMPSPNKTAERFDVGCTDLGIIWSMSPGKVGLFFGDTFGKNFVPVPEGGPGTASNWRSNVLAFSEDTNLEDGLTINDMATDGAGAARQIAYSEHNTSGQGDFTSIPTAAVRANGVDYLHYMNIRNWGGPRGWETNFSSIYSSADDGQTWTRRPEVNFSSTSHFSQICYAKKDGYVYMIGTLSGRTDAAYLARFPEADILDQTKYEYWNKTSGWVKNVESDATAIFEGPVGEISLIYHEKYKQWIVTYLNEKQYGLVYRYAANLTGEWSDVKPLVLGTAFPSLYCAYMHPTLSQGDKLYFLMSIWGYYNVYLMSVDMKFYE